VVVVGTGTDIGKTWVAARLLARLRAQGLTVAARKPAQSFEPAGVPAARDAAVLGASSGEAPDVVCPSHRWYEVPLAPPMAAEALGKPGFTIHDLVDELHWPDSPIDVGLVETAGGVRSPLAVDGDCLALCAELDPDLIVLVADAGLGTINAVRLTQGALSVCAAPVLVVLNRFDAAVDVHVRNREWLLAEAAGLGVLVLPGDELRLATVVRGQG
jgi:dethiobiotin synthetase